MLAARKIVQTQIPASSSRGLSVLALNLEFPHPQVQAKAPTAAKVNQAALETGIRIATRERDSGVVTFKIAVLGGSSTETAAQRGAAQLLSAAAYAGNRTNSGVRLVRFLESLGARFDASFDREKIVYDVSVLADRAEPALATILSAIASAPADAYILEEAKAQAELQYARRAGDVSHQLRDLVHEAAFGDSGLGHSGFASNLKKLDVEQVLAYRQAHFLRENVVVTAAGGITADVLQKLVNVQVAQFPTKSAQALNHSAAKFVGGEVKARAELPGGSDRAAIAIAYPTAAGEGAKATEVLAGVIKRRVAAQTICADAFTVNYSQNGLFGIQAQGNATVASEQLQKVVAELKKVAGGAAPEVDAVKQQLSLERFTAMEGGCATSYLLRGVVTNTAPSKLADLRDVTAQQVSAAAQRLLTQTPAVAVYGATSGTPSVHTVQKWSA